MKKFTIISFVVAFIIAFAMLFTSCAGTKQVTIIDGSEKNITIMTTQKLRALKDFNDDEFVKEIHVFNSAKVGYVLDQSRRESKVEDGVVLATTSNNRTTYELEPETPGKIDSIVRFRNDPEAYQKKSQHGFSVQDIAKIRVKYIVEETGEPIFIWFYQKIVETGQSIEYYFASNKTQETRVNGKPMIGETDRNILMWSYKQTITEKDKKGKIISPFGSNSDQKSPIRPPTGGEKEEQE